ncbi:xanthine dehydrogenase small subunit [Shewanella sp. D64]|uniref:xanthine dehydrogenase small subunit n=1 Tax=unclassified Shewanella TaxID=196818 RepID=UPI0022BA56E1|nr:MULTISPECIES: xanthine dehydrogenase small subunit [unclassified Shewanella]MEC4725233.1 xanthine dehydrogenase small subunit [Shewanella sp. D64]MEC4735921.1 xanthine dehydrogenase small subunit [Shewanella sp. E94]WBJ93112.1 xanthine dehydrogenase small subunit [Shewanella sp. MTB7]
MTISTVRFLLNNEVVTLENTDPNLTVLQYLREKQFNTGTKEGCCSGDCGACTVVVAELIPHNKELDYKSINSCISFVGSLHGKQLITVEDLQDGAKLHHVQQSMVDNHASQCGFCTPGFVMSSFALHKVNRQPSRAQVVEALAGNLCRCTGYRSIIDAAMASSEHADPDSFTQHYQQTVQQLIEFKALPSATLSDNQRSYFAPKNVTELAAKLLEQPSVTLVAGGTDLALSVTQNLNIIDDLVYLGDVDELRVLENNDQQFVIGSAVPYNEFTPMLHDEYHELGEMIERIGSRQVRNNGTLGGNVGNASPIGDMPPALIALGAEMTLQRGNVERKIVVEDFFVAYKKTVLQESEFIKCFYIPKAKPSQFLKLYKISKRIDDDISAVLAAFFIDIKDNVVIDLRLAFGGMAGIPMRAKQCEAALLSKPLNQANITAAQQALTHDFQPMSDVRASDKYRMKVAQNLLQKCYLELKNRNIETRVVSYA